MEKIKQFRNKTRSDSTASGILDKITKRYSTVSNKFLRRSPSRKDSSGSQPVSGSYDMTGADSDDHKIEIGAPVLISKTYIGDHLEPIKPIDEKSPNISIGSDDIFVDANSSIPSSVGEIQFQFFPSSNLKNEKDEDIVSTGDGSYDIVHVPASPVQTESFKLLRPKSRSQSANNLTKPELKIQLSRTPSLELKKTHEQQMIDLCYDFPKKIVPVNCDNKPKTTIEESQTLISSESKNDIFIDDKSKEFAKELFLSIEKINQTNEQLFNSDLEDLHDSDHDTPVIYRSNNSLNETLQNSIGVRCASKDSFKSDQSFKDFDLKSISFESLPNNNDEDFMSVKDINWIKEEFDKSIINLDYCNHRDRLKPCERRITLLRNKNSKIVNIDDKKEKLTKKWSGFKSWIGEEKGKIKDVVQRHAALQRVGAGNIVKNQAFFDKMNRDENGSSQRTSVYSERTTTAETTPERDSEIDEILGDGSKRPSICRSASEISSSNRGGSEDRSIKSFAGGGKKIKGPGHILEGQNGFEELRRYVKQGGDFGKDLVSILQERIESEQLYAKSLSKMASKLSKACREIPGSIADAWRGVATEMESRSEVHRQFSNSLTEDIVKPLKTILDNQHKTRKSIESTVDKSSRVLSEWRVSEAKAKKSSHTAARENEKLQDAMLDVRITRSPSVGFLHTAHNGKGNEKETKSNEKDCVKLDNKRKKAEDAVKRADVEYYTICVRSERARVDWEMSVLRGSTVLQSLENQRLTNLKNCVTSYLKLSSDMNPVMAKIVERLTPAVNLCNIQKDMIIVRDIRRSSEGPSEQLLPDFYCEHTTLAMNRDRRKQSLVKLLQLVRQDLERERRSRNGLKELSQTLTAVNDNQNLTDKLYHIRSMLTYLEGARYKLQSALFELDHKPRGSHPLAPHIQITRDRTGLQQSILKVPLWLKNSEDENDGKICDGDPKQMNIDDEYTDEHDCSTLETNQCAKNDVLIKQFSNGNYKRSKSNIEYSGTIDIPVNGKSNSLSTSSNATDSPIWDRGIADGNSNQPDSDFDEFSSQDEDDDISKDSQNQPAPVVISKCKAIYSYKPKLYDELELTPGDIIEVYNKQEDGWWYGATKTNVGIFPATYVEEII